MDSRWCPCPLPWEPGNPEFNRRLQEAVDDPPQGETWEMIYVGVVLIVMFAVLLSDKIGVSARFHAEIIANAPTY